MAGKYDNEDSEGEEIEYNGFYAVLGYRVCKKIEPVVRFDTYTPVKSSYDDSFVKRYCNIGLGINYFYSKNVKIQANYIIRNKKLTDIDPAVIGGIFVVPPQWENKLFYINFQYSF